MTFRPSARAVDAALTAALAVAMTLLVNVADEPDSKAPDALAYLLGLAVAALLPLHRRWPMGALIGSVGVLFLYFGLDYPAFGPAVPLAATAYFAATAGHVVPAATLLTGVVLAGLGWQTVGEDSPVLSVIGRDWLANGTLLAAVLLLGETVRTRRAWAEEVAGRRVQEERLRIARELHDVIAHTIAGLTVQAGVAADVLDDAPEQARASLAAIREQSRRATAELRATVGLLRDGEAPAPRAPAPGVSGLDALVETAAAGGLRVGVSVAGTPRRLPGAVDVTAYRIVQEALTNVIRHADASRVGVEIRYEPEAVVVQVADDGRAPANGAGDGHGLVGMRERVAAIGGALEAGPAAGGGFRVRAELPTCETAP